jgi:hypothetical protein
VDVTGHTDIDRRRFPRRAYDEQVYCYLECGRVRGRPADISLGGIFLKLEPEENVPLGSTVGLVFDRRQGLSQPAYLLAVATRVQDQPLKGIGLAWERAVTAAEPTELAQFLSSLFGIRADVLERLVVTGRGRQRSLFVFAALGLPGARPAGTPPQPPRPEVAQRRTVTWAGSAAVNQRVSPLTPSRVEVGLRAEASTDPNLPAQPPHPALHGRGPIGLATSVEELEHLDVQVVMPEGGSEHGATRAYVAAREAAAAPRDGGVERTAQLLRPPQERIPPARPQRPSTNPGTITDQIDRQRVRAAANQPATMLFREVSLPVTIRSLGIDSLFVETRVRPVGASEGLIVRFEVPAREGSVAIGCSCRIVGEEDGEESTAPGLELAIQELDEGGHPGILRRYVRWLHFNTL